MTATHGSRFEPAVAASADPSSVRRALSRFGEGGRARLAGDDALLDAIVAVAAASTSLGRFVADDPAALEVLADPGRRVALDTSSPDRLARTRRLAFLQIVAGELLGTGSLDATMGALSDLAAAALAGAVRLAGADELALIGMGKLGGRELNFVSDVDVVLVGEGDPVTLERAARSALAIAGRCFRVDVDLRPEGRDGPLVRSLDSYRAYWSRWARPWEFQALLKARPVAGDEALDSVFADAAADALWSRSFDADAIREVRRLKQRVEQAVEAEGLTDRDLKRGRGGIRDIEFSVQLLQLVHGGADASLRNPATRHTLRELVAGDYVDAGEAATLEQAYVLLRRVEHALQLVDERRTHTVPTDRVARRRLARVLGYRGTVSAGATERFDHDLAMHRLAVRRVHEGWYFRPLLDAFAGGGGPTRDVSDTRLAAFGFTEADRTRQAVAELTGGLTRGSRLMRQLLPLLLDWLADSPDPDRGLLGLRRLASGPRRSQSLSTAFRDSAEVARNLCLLAGSSTLAVELLEANPDLVVRLDDPGRLQTLDRAGLVASAERAVTWRATEPDAQGALRRWWQRHLLGIVARDLLGHADTGSVGRDLARLAEAVTEVALKLLSPRVPLAVIGLGRLGGEELAYGSDLDLVVVYDGAGAADQAEGERVAAGLVRLVSATTPAARIMAVDADLRPEGRAGPLARSLDSYTVYLDRWAETWERQALLRSRAVAGDVDVGRRFGALVDVHLWSHPPTPDDVRAMRRMKARIERERVRDDEARVHLKLGPGGLLDVEFTVQLRQWQEGVHRTATLPALAALEARGAVAESDAAVLAEAHRFCDRVRNRRHLVLGPGDTFPSRPDALRVLARSLDTSANELREEHLRLTRRARVVVERTFYTDTRQ